MTDKAELKSLLCSLFTLNDEERDFEIEYSSGSPRRIRGAYIAKRKILRLYPNTVNKALAKRQASLELVGAALHEFAHHLHVTRNKVALTSRFHQGKKIPLHGAEFKKILEELLAAFNFRSRESLKGLMVYNRRRARVPPRFVRFDQMPNATGIDMGKVMTGWKEGRESQDSRFPTDRQRY